MNRNVIFNFQGCFPKNIAPCQRMIFDGQRFKEMGDIITIKDRSTGILLFDYTPDTGRGCVIVLTPEGIVILHRTWIQILE